ncbi:hypothetical protein ABK905_07445 [Acerihabitans sp. KWT182]|uniref:Lipoprotein n=1 Tax=Acerihabitans sp. KWT182 TaxID=3157919 RepID=A0AAU7QCW6_9GAMM
MEKTTIAALFCVFALTGCARTEPVLNISEPISGHLSADEVRIAILQAGIEREWVMTPAAPGIINGHLSQREHRVDIRISYSPTGYSINYVDSRNLKAKDGLIHRSYNRWIHNLDHDIQLKLATKRIE